MRFAAAAVGCAVAGSTADMLVARGWDPTAVRKVAQLVGTLGPGTALLVLAWGSESLDYQTSLAVFIGALFLHAGGVAGYSVGVQDISRKSASIISGATAGLGVMAGAASHAASVPGVWALVQ